MNRATLVSIVRSNNLRTMRPAKEFEPPTLSKGAQLEDEAWVVSPKLKTWALKGKRALVSKKSERLDLLTSYGELWTDASEAFMACMTESGGDKDGILKETWTPIYEQDGRIYGTIEAILTSLNDINSGKGVSQNQQRSGKGRENDSGTSFVPDEVPGDTIRGLITHLGKLVTTINNMTGFFKQCEAYGYTPAIKIVDSKIFPDEFSDAYSINNSDLDDHNDS